MSVVVVVVCIYIYIYIYIYICISVTLCTPFATHTDVVIYIYNIYYIFGRIICVVVWSIKWLCIYLNNKGRGKLKLKKNEHTS